MMIKFNLNVAKEIGGDPGINWNKASADELTEGLNIELEHGKITPETNVLQHWNILINIGFI